jgi:hypothetical protein
MPLKITHKNEDEVPTPTSAGKVNEDLAALKAEMQKLASWCWKSKRAVRRP